MADWTRGSFVSALSQLPVLSLPGLVPSLLVLSS
jgi:hypothetical protein